MKRNHILSYCILFVSLFILIMGCRSFNETSLLRVSPQTDLVESENVTFRSEGVHLAGTIYKPKEPHAAAVIVHGSGQAGRETEFADLLARHNISVFTYDKRGVGESEGVYRGPEVGTNNVDSTNLCLLAKDASAAVDVLQKEVKNVPVGLLGFSQAWPLITFILNLQ